MTLPRMLLLCLLAPTTLLATACFAENGWQTAPCPEHNGDHSSGDHGFEHHVCELRSTTFKLASGKLTVDGDPNGGISVVGEDRSDVQVEARVNAWASSQEAAQSLLSEIKVEASGDTVHATGPRLLMMKGYGVDYKVHAPRKIAAQLNASNGGIEIAHLDGNIRFQTTNGGVELKDLAGDVQGRTVNGGLSVTLSGDRWHGAGLNASTTNGGVSVEVPAKFAAHLEAGTVNGGVSVDFPVTVQGKIRQSLSVDLNGGGPTVHTETTNGGVEITRGSE